ATDALLAGGEAAAPASAQWSAGMLHLAAYALDPANTEYGMHRGQRAAAERWRWPHRAVDDDHLMPQAPPALARAVRHLSAAADQVTGRTRGMLLAQVAFAE